MGAHPGDPSRVDRGDGPRPLTDVIAADPERELGARTLAAFGPRLPFLLKLLAADAPLSLQVHPDAATARAGFADEEARGVPRDAPHRNYKDDQHKPELICALTPFEGLCGFRRAEEAAALLAGLRVDALTPYVDALRARPEAAALREVLTALLTADRDATARTVDQAARAAGERAGQSPAYAACADVAGHHPGDPGVLATLLLHHVVLQPGQALHLGAGVPHAYLHGLGVEIMANSDNVLRCGLTTKHVDVPELLRVVRFEPAEPAVLTPQPAGGGEQVYRTPTAEFRLSRYRLAPGGPDPEPVGDAPQILLCTEGEAVLHAGDDGAGLRLTPGGSAWLPAGEKVRVHGEGTIFRATVAD
jgi:mannose-6-phosphate isomerase